MFQGQHRLGRIASQRWDSQGDNVTAEGCASFFFNVSGLRIWLRCVRGSLGSHPCVSRSVCLSVSSPRPHSLPLGNRPYYDGGVGTERWGTAVNDTDKDFVLMGLMV